MNLEINWHNLPRSESVDADVHKHIEKLGKFCSEMTGARMVIDQPHHQQQKPNNFRVTLELYVPNNNIVVDRVTSAPDDDNLYHLIHHVFDAARRQLQDYVRIRQGKVKRHSNPSPPKVEEL